MMVRAIGIKYLKDKEVVGKMYYFGVNNLQLEKEQFLIVVSDKGEEIVKSVSEVISIEEKTIVGSLKDIVRVATKKDIYNFEDNLKQEKKIFREITEMANRSNPEMHIIDVKYTLNKEQLLIYFVSENRVDFRELVKTIASKYRTRIELRQVGVRDEAKVVGGLGVCGRIICCNSYLSDFHTVSINMAKNQALSLVPTKISGVCGRLLCCLKYEDDEYNRLKVGLPKIGAKYETSEGIGKVIGLNVLKRTFKVLIKEKGAVVEVDLNGSN